MMFTNWTCAVVCTVEAMVTHHMAARIEHMGRTRAPAENAGLSLGLHKMDEHFRPPESTSISRNTVGEIPKERFVPLVAADLGKQDSQYPSTKSYQFFNGASRKACTKT